MSPVTRGTLRLATLSSCLLAGAAIAAPGPFTRGFDLVLVKPTAGLDSGIGLEGAGMQQVGSRRFALLFDLNFGLLALKLGTEKLGDLVPFRTDAHLIFAYQLLKRLELGVDLPVTLYQTGNFEPLAERGFPQPGIAAVGLGDLRLLPRIGLFDAKRFPLKLAAVTELRLPTGNESSFLGDRAIVFAPRLALEGEVGPVRLLGDIGYRLRPKAGQYLNLFVGNELALGVGAIVGLPALGRLTGNRLVAEMHLATPTEAPFTFSQSDSLKSPWELLVGVRSKVFKHWGLELDLGRGLGLVTGYGRETFRVVFGIRYDYTFSDRDGDGIPDEVDACPDLPEDVDGFQDEDGCPEPDNDGDGVLDYEDACPMVPGPKEFDGCPDRDRDGVPDNVDKCPDQPGPADNDGCPLPAGPPVVLESDRIRVRGDIQFETAQAAIQPQSFGMLDQVAQVLKDNPEVGPVLIEGHTDNRGTRAYNMDLSMRRAKAVVDYLVTRGIGAKRLKSAGFGFDRPVADNATPLGRAKNRRTEFRLVKEEDLGAPAAPKKR